MGGGPGGPGPEAAGEILIGIFKAPLLGAPSL